MKQTDAFDLRLAQECAMLFLALLAWDVWYPMYMENYFMKADMVAPPAVYARLRSIRRRNASRPTSTA